LADALFRLEGVIKRHQGRPVLNAPRLELGREAVTAISGPNGSGKTTLLMILALLLRPDQGRLFFQGRLVGSNTAERTAVRRRVTYVSQDAYLFQGSVERNLAYGLKVRGMGRDGRGERIAGALEAVGLEGFAGRKARELSRGETQRVALARALALEPRVLLLDEPFANLDPASASVFERVIGGLQSQGVAVVMVTHGRRQAGRLAQRRLELDDGMVVSDLDQGGV